MPAPGEPALTALTAAFLADKIVLLFLEANLESLKNCDVNDCSDKGSEMNLTLRRLLVTRTDADKMRQARAGHRRQPIDRSNHPRYGLTRLTIEKINPARHDVDTFNELYTRIHSIAANLGPELMVALQKGTTAYSYMLRDLYPQAQFPNGPFVPGYFDNALHQMGTNPFLIEYFYDYLYDAVQAYNEFLRTAVQVEAECCPNPDRFPRHVLLGEVKPLATAFTPPAQPNWPAFDPLGADTGLGPTVKPAPFRHHFVPSPLLDRQHHGLRRVQALHTRLYLLAYRYSTQKLMPTELRITPSRSGDYALSDKAVPFYYAFKAGDDFHRGWSFDDTAANRLDQVLSYQFIEAAKHPSLNRMERHNFHRVEGIVGMPLGQALEELKKRKRELGLSFGVEPVYLGVAVQNNATSATLDQRARRRAQRVLTDVLVCRMGDLDAVLLVFMGALFGYVRASLALLSRLDTTKMAQWAGRPGIVVLPQVQAEGDAQPPAFLAANLARAQIVIDPVETEAALNEIRRNPYIKGQMTDQLTTVRDPKLAIGQLYGDLKATPADLFDRTRQFVATLGVVGDIDAMTQKVFRPIALIDRAEELLAAIRAPSLAEFDFADFSAKYDAFTAAFDRYAADAEVNVDRADPTIAAINRELIASYGAVAGTTPKQVVANLASELRQRMVKVFDEMSLPQYAQKHPGMEHRAGVAAGGTLVLIYTHKQTLSDVIATQKEFLDGKFKDSAVKFSRAPDQAVPAVDPPKLLSAIPGGQNPRDEFIVVADFCLPYLCCDALCSEIDPRPIPPDEPEPQPGVITGTVSGRNVAGAPVALRAATVKLTNRENTTVDATFRDGAYTATVPPGPYRVEAASPRFVTQSRTVTIRSGVTQREDFILEPERVPDEQPFGITGTVFERQAGGQVPLRAAQVKITEPNTGAALDVSIDAGEYKAGGPKGTYRIDVASRRFVSQSRTITAASGANLTENFILEPEQAPDDRPFGITGTVFGRNQAGTQTPLRAATVRITEVNTGAALDVSFDTGVYKASGPRGAYRIDVASPRFVAQTRNVTAASGASLTEDFVLVIG